MAHTAPTAVEMVRALLLSASVGKELAAGAEVEEAVTVLLTAFVGAELAAVEVEEELAPQLARRAVDRQTLIIIEVNFFIKGFLLSNEL